MEALGSNDDFILPSDVDTTLKCIDLNDLKDSKFGLPFAASISLICYFYLFWMYFIINSPVFKRHPTSKNKKFYPFNIYFSLSIFIII